MERNNAKYCHSSLQGPRLEELTFKSWFYPQPWTSHLPSLGLRVCVDWARLVVSILWFAIPELPRLNLRTY